MAEEDVVKDEELDTEAEDDKEEGCSDCSSCSGCCS